MFVESEMGNNGNAPQIGKNEYRHVMFVESGMGKQ